MYKLVNCVQKLVNAQSMATAASMIRACKEQFDIPQDYKERIGILPQHFIAMMIELYKDLMYEVCEGAFNKVDKDELLIDIDRKFREKADQVLSVITDSNILVGIFMDHASSEFDKLVIEAEQASKPAEPTVFEKSVEEKEAEVTTAELKNSTIENMIEYVNKLPAEQRLALIYALGIKDYMATATTAEAEEVTEDIKFGIYSAEDIIEKSILAISGHNYSSENFEIDVLYKVVEGVSGKELKAVIEEAGEKLDKAFNLENDLDGFLEELDAVSEEITEVVGFDIVLMFVDNCLVLSVASIKGVSTASLSEVAQEKYNEIKSVIEESQMKKIDGVMLDIQTANLLITVIDAMSSETKEKFLKEKLAKMAQIARKVVANTEASVKYNGVPSKLEGIKFNITIPVLIKSLSAKEYVDSESGEVSDYKEFSIEYNQETMAGSIENEIYTKIVKYISTLTNKSEREVENSLIPVGSSSLIGFSNTFKMGKAEAEAQAEALSLDLSNSEVNELVAGLEDLIKQSTMVIRELKTGKVTKNLSGIIETANMFANNDLAQKIYN